MKRLTLVPAYMPRHKVRDIGSAVRRRAVRDRQVIDLHAYTGRNVVRLRPRNEPTPAA